MEGKKLTQNKPTWSSIKLTSPLQLPNEKKLILNNTKECESPKSTKENDDDDKGKEAEEMHSESEKVEKEEITGRERLKRVREEAMELHVKIPENWGQEQQLLKDYTMFDALFLPHRLIVTARDALIADHMHGRQAKSQRLRI